MSSCLYITSACKFTAFYIRYLCAMLPTANGTSSEYLGQVRISRSSGQCQGHSSKLAHKCNHVTHICRWSAFDRRAMLFIFSAVNVNCYVVSSSPLLVALWIAAHEKMLSLFRVVISLFSHHHHHRNYHHQKSQSSHSRLFTIMISE